MKDIIVGAAILTAVITVMVFYQKALVKSGNDILETLDTLQSSAAQEEWENVNGEVTALQEKWENTSKWLSAFIDHQEVDNIVIALSNLEQYALYRETPDFMAEISALRSLIKHLTRKEKPIFENIF